MGFFDNSNVTTVATFGTRLLEPKNIPNSVLSGAVQGLAKNGSVPEYVSEALVSSMGLRAESMYKYGDRKYFYGSPSGEIYSANQGTSQVLALLTSLYGSAVSIDYSRLGLSNPMHLGWTLLIDEYGYDPGTNTLELLKDPDGKATYLKDLQVVIPTALASIQPTVLEQWGVAGNAGPSPSRNGSNLFSLFDLAYLSYSPFILSDLISEPRLLITYEWETINSFSGAVTIEEKKLEVAIPSKDPNRDFFHVRFYVDDKVRYQQFPIGTGEYPTLDQIIQSPLKPLGSFFPFLHLRNNKKSLNTDKEGEAYKSSVKLADYISVDVDQLIEGIEKNENVKDVTQAVLMLAVPVDTKDQLELRYLFDYFEKLHFAGTNQYQTTALAELDYLLSGESLMDKIRGGYNRSVKGTIVIRDKLFSMSIHNSGTFKRLKAGVLGKIGTYASDIGTYETTSKGVGYDGDPVSVITTRKFHAYRKQISDVIYEEVRVEDLTMNFYIEGYYTASTFEGNAIAVMPLDNSITRSYSLPDREKLYSSGLHLVFNARQDQEVKWYQREEFGAVLKIIGVIILVVTWDPQWLVMATAAMAGGAALISFIYAVAAALIQQIVIAFAIKLFIQEVGMDVALIVAIVAAAVGLYKLNAAEWSLKLAPMAKDLLLASTALSQGINNRVLTLMGELKDDSDRFNLYTSEQEKKLKESTALLDSSVALTPFTVFGESPDEYFARTVHSGNVGILGLDAVESFVDMALMLPKLPQPIDPNESYV